MSAKGVTLPEYNKRAFVNREEEVDLVLKKAHGLAAGQRVGKRTVIFMGERGTGKTWLLRHLQTLLLEVPKVIALRLDLADYDGWDPLVAVTDILQNLTQSLHLRLHSRVGEPAKLSRHFVEEMRKQLRDRVLVLLVDHVYETEWEILDKLEDYVLGPLAIESQTLIVLAGRGRPYPFRTPELRFDAEFKDLDLFDETKTREQLTKQRERAAFRFDEIFHLSKGNPLANYLLAEYENPGEALNQVIDEILKGLVDADQRRNVREYLEALCVLQAFDEARIPIMLAAYHEAPQYQNWSHAQAREVREQVVTAGFAQWDAEVGGYVLDKPTRLLIEQYMKDNEQSTWERLQRAAIKLYQDWKKRYTRTQDRWKKEQDYHCDQLESIGKHSLVHTGCC